VLVDVVVTAGVTGRGDGVAAAELEAGAVVVAGAGVVVGANIVVAGPDVVFVTGAVDDVVAGADVEGVEGVAAGAGVAVDVVVAAGHGPYIPPHNCAKPGFERVTNKNARRANWGKETLNIASISSQPIG
jgi:hypothetical protein